MLRFLKKLRKGTKSVLPNFQAWSLPENMAVKLALLFTVRTTLAGVGVERVFPLHSTKIQKLEILSSPKKFPGLSFITSGIFPENRLARKWVRRNKIEIQKKIKSPERVILFLNLMTNLNS